ncbi:hypothetical protein JB92DRAFT_2829780 [Gautieria morchelliformis]|nr:hypothetical protein JB92DRAFT_2829780 [Gautieria morchelliformis]
MNRTRSKTGIKLEAPPSLPSKLNSNLNQIEIEMNSDSSSNCSSSPHSSPMSKGAQSSNRITMNTCVAPQQRDTCRWRTKEGKGVGWMEGDERKKPPVKGLLRLNRPSPTLAIFHGRLHVYIDVQTLTQVLDLLARVRHLVYPDGGRRVLEEVAEGRVGAHGERRAGSWT